MLLGDGVGVGVGAPVAAKMSVSCQIASMVWAPKQAKGAASAGLERESTRRLNASVTVSVENIVGMETLWGKTCTVLVASSPHVSGM